MAMRTRGVFTSCAMSEGQNAFQSLHVVTKCRSEPTVRAIIYLRDLRVAPACHDYCEVRGYRILGVVYDPDGDRFEALWAEVRERGEAEVIIVHNYRDLPSDRTPRIEEARLSPAELPPVPPSEPHTTPRRRRPRRTH